MKELHTYCICEKCGATIRASRHSEGDCKTIKELQVKIDALKIESDALWWWIDNFAGYPKRAWFELECLNGDFTIDRARIVEVFKKTTEGK
jgi:hypothetical protein